MDLVCRYFNQENFKPRFASWPTLLHWYVGPDILYTEDHSLFTIAGDDGEIPEYTRLAIVSIGTVNAGTGKLYTVRLAGKEEKTNRLTIATPMKLVIQPFL